MKHQPLITAQISSGDDAYVAIRRSQLGDPDKTFGEIWHTADRGHSWRPVSWRRTVRSYFSRAAFARWPPEWVNRMWLEGKSLELEVWEDRGLGVSDPIWRATLLGNKWNVRFEREYKSEKDGGIIPRSLELDLPGITTSPTWGPFR